MLQKAAVPIGVIRQEPMARDQHQQRSDPAVKAFPKHPASHLQPTKCMQVCTCLLQMRLGAGNQYLEHSGRCHDTGGIRFVAAVPASVTGPGCCSHTHAEFRRKQ